MEYYIQQDQLKNENESIIRAYDLGYSRPWDIGSLAHFIFIFIFIAPAYIPEGI